MTSATVVEETIKMAKMFPRKGIAIFGARQVDTVEKEVHIQWRMTNMEQTAEAQPKFVIQVSKIST